MKLSREISQGLLTVTAVSPEAVSVDGVPYRASLLLEPQTLSVWHVRRAADIDAQAIADIAARKPSLVLLGTGPRQHFLPAAVLRPLIEAGIGYEFMDTAAACRTFNLLASEGRRVLAALVLEDF
ncbi:MAG: hypothetical protein CGU28_07980 [Candidatus Dactylopiibacterium carminicum]|uniref:Xcc1710-like domain-containing protein n=1 Tax=Candidatus Dactylopiibacterium carminicum TaxID=857335 RepID=A0A272ESL4_9RHOO|nr:MTH938/NDUFAF3 family protein [Candidatus Dactylopiibacterium carminicum]KAF7599082.1 hypothetical protein BGI27_09950 [Candidatus Dactylopiibacterium carminicum]PAS93109.1 MAG: hypothetical protein CGU29_09010 [Candidatus Dactylopiibacterium carminicum]PAS96672.1 MAG: hypothetical protein CGU28_07980 [Candidatus Dactylopiibacterium carminicum]PAS99096.1 MAG: hypothetical protein BSR46_09985 [Candidatus Dactylopiibacterium carminicum]